MRIKETVPVSIGLNEYEKINTVTRFLVNI